MKKKSNGLTPFKHVDRIYTSTSPYGGDTGYAQYIINKELSKNGMMIELVNTIQKYTLPNNTHFKLLQFFYSKSRRPGFKQFPWIWKSQTKDHEDVELLALHFNESFDHAEQYYQILMNTKEGKETIKSLRLMYGKDGKKK